MSVIKDFNPIEHDRTVEDRSRHKKLVEDSIKKNLVDILSEESLIGEIKNKKIKIPIRGIKEYEFIYGKNVNGVGSGDGDEKRGDKIGQDEEGLGKNKNKGSGNEDEEEMYETEITIDEIMEYVFEDLELPHLKNKKVSEILSEGAIKKKGYQKNGIKPRFAKKKSAIERLKRKQGMKKVIRESEDKNELKEKLKNYDLNKRVPYKQEDLRFFRVKPKKKKEFNAVVMCIMDTSASMDQNKKYLARSFFFMICQFVKMRYSSVEVVFIAHSTTAKIVNENEFFHKVESGGTYISSGYQKTLELIKEKYSPFVYNIYGFHVSDGDNWSEDNDKAVLALDELCNVCNLFGYAEIMSYGYVSTIKKRYMEDIHRNNFMAVTMKKKEDLWQALKDILKQEIKNVVSNEQL